MSGKADALLSRLLKVGSMADSLGVYVPAMMFQKALNLVRVLLFMYLLARVQYGLWGLAVMVFNLAATVMTLGSSQGLARYVSYYEVRGRLTEFYRGVRWAILVLGAGLLLVSLLGSDLVTSLAFVSRQETADLSRGDLLHVCWLALANGLALALYANLLGFMLGLRAYRLVSVVEVLFSVAFTVTGVAGLATAPSAMSLLTAHLVSLIVTMGMAIPLLERGLGRLEAERSDKPNKPIASGTGEAVLDIGAETEELTGAMPTTVSPVHEPGEQAGGSFARVLKFGLVSLLGAMLWHALGYLSFWITSRRLNKEEGAVFFAYLSLGQFILFVANAVWAVVFSHVARWWEANDRRSAMLTLQAAYKAIAMALMAATVLAYVLSPIWVRILPNAYEAGRSLLGGVLMFFQAVAHLALMTILAKLYERPVVIALAGVAALAGNFFLAVWFMGMPDRFPYAPDGAAWAAGVGTYAGAGAVTLVYFLLGRIRLNFGSYLIMASPVLFLMAWVLPVWSIAVVWAGVCAAGVFTPLVFTTREKEILAASIRSLVAPLRRVWA